MWRQTEENSEFTEKGCARKSETAVGCGQRRGVCLQAVADASTRVNHIDSRS